MNLYRHKNTGTLSVLLGIEDGKAGELRAHYERVGALDGPLQAVVHTLPLQKFFDTHDQITDKMVSEWRAAWLKTT